MNSIKDNGPRCPYEYIGLGRALYSSAEIKRWRSADHNVTGLLGQIGAARVWLSLRGQHRIYASDKRGAIPGLVVGASWSCLHIGRFKRAIQREYGMFD